MRVPPVELWSPGADVSGVPLMAAAVRPDRTDAVTPGRRPARAVSAAIVLTAVLAVLPAPTGWDVYGTRFFGLLAAAAAWLVAGLLGALRVPERRDGPMIGAAVVFAAAIVVSTVAGYAPLEMLTFGNAYYSGALTWFGWLIIAVSASLVRPSSAVRSGLQWAQLPVAAIALVAVLTPGDIPMAWFDNSNHLAPGLLVMLPVSLGLASSTRVSRWRWISRGTALLSAGALGTSGSLTAILALAVVLVLSAWFAPALLGVPDRWRRALRTSAAIGTVLALAVVVLAALVPDALPASAETALGSSLSSRSFYWRAAIDATSRSPVLGLGADGFEVAAQELVDASPGAQAVLRGAFAWSPVAGDAHNVVLTVLVCFGLLGFAAAATYGGSWGAALLRLLKEGERSTFRIACGIGVATWFIAMLALPLSVQWGGLPAVIFGLAVSRPGARESETRRPVVLAALRPVAGVVAVSLVAGSVWVLSGMAMFASASGRPAESYLSTLERAATLQPTNVYYRFVALQARGELLDGSAGQLEAYQRAVDGAGPAILEDERYMAMLVRLSLDEAFVSGRADLQWEEAWLGRMASRAPLLPELVMERAHLALLQGDAESALDLLLRVKDFEATLGRSALYHLYYARLTGNMAAEGQLVQVVTGQGVPERLLPR